MYALTLWPEWVPAIQHLGKRVENRTWHPPAHLLGKRIAIHAGATFGGGNRSRGFASVVDVAERAGCDVRFDLGPARTWRLRGSRPARFGGVDVDVPVFTRRILGTVELHAVRDATGTPWAHEGSLHWHLRDLRWLPDDVELVVSGGQGFWRVPKYELNVLAERGLA